MEKAPYKKMAAIDKTRYTKEKFDPPPQTILPAYLLFVRDRQMRQAVLDENPELSTAGVMTELGEFNIKHNIPVIMSANMF